MHFDPAATVEEIRSRLNEAATAAWGEGAVAELDNALATAATSIWRVSQEPFSPTDVEP
jgi:hypothetical protein